MLNLGQLNGWCNPGDYLMFVVSNWTVAGAVNVRIWYEYASREMDVPQSVSIKESVEIDTRPFGGWLKRLEL